MTDYDFLTNISLFEGMDHDDLHRLANKVGQISLEPAEVLFFEGDEGDRAYVIKEGELEIIQQPVYTIGGAPDGENVSNGSWTGLDGLTSPPG